MDEIIKRQYKLVSSDVGDFIVDENDDIGRFLLKGGVWEGYLVDLMSRFCMPDWVAIDAGANFGTHTITLGKLCKKVYAFECQKMIYNQLCANVMLNGLDYKIETFKTAVGDKKEIKQLWKIDFERRKNNVINWGGRGIEQDFIPHDIDFNDHREYDQVQVETIDSYNFSNCDIIKMDIQGYELKALIGADNLLKKHKPLILLENGCIENSELEQNIKTKQHLFNLGYEIYRLDFDVNVFKGMGDYTKDNIIVIHPKNKYYQFIRNSFDNFREGVLFNQETK